MVIASRRLRIGSDSFEKVPWRPFDENPALPRAIECAGAPACGRTTVTKLVSKAGSISQEPSKPL